MYKVPSISRSNQWFRTVCGLNHGMHNSTQYRAVSHAMYLWQLTPRSLLPQSPHLGTEPLFLVYKYTRRPPGVFELWYGVNVCIGISSGGTIQIKHNTTNYTHTNIRICDTNTASTVHRYTHPLDITQAPTLTPTLSQNQPERMAPEFCSPAQRYHLSSNTSFDFWYRSFTWTALLDQWPSNYH